MNIAAELKPLPATLRGYRIAVALLSSFGIGGLAHAQDALTMATTICAACHGADGNSIAPIFPSLSGLQESYIVKQLNDFMSGKRKNDMMTPIVAQIKPADVQPLAEYFSKQKRERDAPTNRMAASAGKVIYNEGNDETGVPACVGCHQPKGVGFDLYPKINSQKIEYIKQQLKNFATGERANDQSRFMRTTAKRMSEEEMEDVAQYLAGASDN